MVGSRDYQVFPLYGEQKNEGALDYSLFPTNGINVLAAAIGSDTNQELVTGVSTTLAAGVSAGYSVIDLTSVTGVVAESTVLTIGTGATAEQRLVLSITGTNVTLTEALLYYHPSGTAVTSAGTGTKYRHTITQLPILNSLTIEKNLGDYQSVQYAGGQVNKFSVKGQAGNTEATVTADIIAQSFAILTTPSAISLVDESPFVFSEYVLTWGGNVLAQSANFQLDIDNGVTPVWTFNGTPQAQFIPALHLMVNGQFEAVFDSLNDPQYGFFAMIQNGDEAPLTYQMTDPSTGYSIEFEMPNVRLSKEEVPPTIDKVITETVHWEARRSLSADPSETIRAYVVNGDSSPIS